MKIFEIKPVNIIKEGAVEPNLMLSIRNIINRGKADNTFEFVCVARVLQLLKAGTLFASSNPLFDANLSTSKELMDLLRALPPGEMVAIATKLWSILQTLNRDQIDSYANAGWGYAQWIKYYTAREAND